MLTREEFEAWLDDHRDEAMERIEVDRMPLRKWVSIYSLALRAEATATPCSDYSSAIEDDDKDPYGSLGEDEEED